MKIDKKDVFICDLIYDDVSEETSYWDEVIRDLSLEFKRPEYKVREKSILVIKVGEGLYIKPRKLLGAHDLKELRRKVLKYGRRADSRILRDSRSSFDEDFLGRFRPRFSEDGFVDLEDLILESKKRYVIINHTL